MSSLTIHDLPEELLLHTFHYLESAAPSIVKSRREPNIDLTSAKTHSLKDVSQVSWRWRRISLPLLFRYSRLRLHATPSSEWLDCPVCGTKAFANDIKSPLQDQEILDAQGHHANMFKAAYETLETQSTTLPLQDEQCKSSLQWAGYVYHRLQDYLDYLRTNSLGTNVQSFTIVADQALSPRFHRFPHNKQYNRDFRYPASSALWQHLLSKIAPSRIAVVAPPTELAFWTNCSIDMFGDWAFGDMVRGIPDRPDTAHTD